MKKNRYRAVLKVPVPKIIMSVIFLILKILGTLVLVLFGLGWGLALIITRKGLTTLRKKGKMVTGKVINSKVISNKRCNSLPGYHYKIEYEFQRHAHKYDGIYEPAMRYLSQTAAQKMVDSWSVDKKIQVFYDRDEPDINICELDTWKDLLFSISIIIASVGAIILTWI